MQILGHLSSDLDMIGYQCTGHFQIEIVFKDYFGGVTEPWTKVVYSGVGWAISDIFITHLLLLEPRNFGTAAG